jgi:hypothetical protein
MGSGGPRGWLTPAAVKPRLKSLTDRLFPGVPTMRHLPTWRQGAEYGRIADASSASVALLATPARRISVVALANPTEAAPGAGSRGCCQYARLVAAFLPAMLAEDRMRAGWSVGQAARRLRVRIAIYREIEAGLRSPTWETWDRICKTFGWPQTFR